MPLIQIENLTFSYPNSGDHRPIINGINLSIEAGELIAIQGPSGSGKSTLLYLLGLLSSPNSGEFIFDGQVVKDQSDEQLAQFRNKKIGFVFQHFHLLPKSNVLDNILLPIHYSKEGSLFSKDGSPKAKFEQRAKDLAQRVGLQDHLHHKPNQLSGGQQQRVAICRALINDPDILLADEPTGNLDSKSTEQTLKILTSLHRDLKKTVIIITHDQNVAQLCDRVIYIKDGQVEKEESRVGAKNNLSHSENLQFRDQGVSSKGTFLANSLSQNLTTALKNLNRNLTRTLLTMVGICVGIAAVVSLMTLGEFIKKRILAGYAELGVNTLVFRGYANWQQKATDKVPAQFEFFHWERDILPLKTVFNEIDKLAPLLSSRNYMAVYGGKVIDHDVEVMGVNEETLFIANRKILLGRNFSKIEIEQFNNVCIIGFEIAERFFSNRDPIGQALLLNSDESSMGCRVVGVLDSMTSNKDYMKPNLQIYLPFTYYQRTAGRIWEAQLRRFLIQAKPGSDVEKLSTSLQRFFELKYGNSGRFSGDSDSVLVDQMRKFLSLFTLLLTTIALITLTVGGVGITNMMLVSVSERFREIGLRKALGATNRTIKSQFLLESLIICSIAGIVGLLLGIGSYELAIWGASKIINKLTFEWIIDPIAIFSSLMAILLVGFFSGLFPAIKAEKLQVIEALRNE